MHAETSTGVRSDIAALGAGKGDALLLVDAVTSIGGIELQAETWGIDVGYAPAPRSWSASTSRSAAERVPMPAPCGGSA